jgi:hypothetical protein
LPREYQPDRGPTELSPRFYRTVVDYPAVEPPGTIIIDTPNTYLYLTMGHGKALRYGIGVGREGFTWSGTEHISRMKEWPDWFPPQEMIKRQPYLPRFMAGGETNPLGARAMYLGNTQYRIHGTNQPSTIGSFVSSSCIRLTNEDVEDLYSRVTIGTWLCCRERIRRHRNCCQGVERRDGRCRLALEREVLGARFGNKANKVGWNGRLVSDKLLIVNAGSTARTVLTLILVRGE